MSGSFDRLLIYLLWMLGFFLFFLSFRGLGVVEREVTVHIDHSWSIRDGQSLDNFFF